MPHEIFGAVSCPPKRLGSQSWYTLPLSIVVHAIAVTIVVIVPLMATDVIPRPSSILTAVVAPPDVPDPPPMPVAQRAVSPAAPAAQHVIQPVSTTPAAPTEAGNTIAEEATGPPLPPGRAEVGPPAEVVGSPAGRSGGIGIPAPPPAPTGPVRPGGQVKYPEKIRDVRPIYPQVAVAGRVEGRVLIEATIGIDGRVKDAQILKSIALLDRAALEAVQQWRFTPTLLNGVPVPVIITVTVDFKLH